MYPHWNISAALILTCIVICTGAVFSFALTMRADTFYDCCIAFIISIVGALAFVPMFACSLTFVEWLTRGR